MGTLGREGVGINKEWVVPLKERAGRHLAGGLVVGAGGGGWQANDLVLGFVG